MILSRRLDVLELKSGCEYYDYFEGFEKFVKGYRAEDLEHIYSITFCHEDSWIPLYIMVYEDIKGGVRVLYSSDNKKVINACIKNEGRHVLENYLNLYCQKVVYAK